MGILGAVCAVLLIVAEIIGMINIRKIARFLGLVDDDGGEK